jgi:cold shock CspA family protein
MAEGTVRWISSTKHFGFLVLDDGSRDVFVRSLRHQRKTLFVA